MARGNPDPVAASRAEPALRTITSLVASPLGRPPPAPLSRFIGRRAELDAAAALLADNRLVTLTGTGGIGKTRLASELARSGVLDQLGGTAWVDLARAADAPGVDAALLGAFELTRGAGALPVDLVADHLGAARGLVIIDDCEQVADAVGERARQILERCPELRVLATSRVPLGLSGEATWVVPPLSLEDGAGGENTDAVSLFISRARSAVGELAIGGAELSIVDAICRALEGVPLAIELAAAQLRVASLTEIRDRLVDRLDLLAGGPRLEQPRHRAVRASIDWSYGLLGERERVLLRRISVFAGGWDLDSLAAVCAGDGLEAAELPALLEQLVLHSIVLVDRSGPATRYSLLESIRQYARERLVDAGEATALADRHVGYFLALAQKADDEYWAVDRRRRAILEREAANFAAALAHNRDAGDIRALELAGHLALYWREIGAMEQGADAVARALEATPKSPSRARALALMWHGCFVFHTGDFPRAFELLSNCEQMLEQAPSARAAAWVAGLRATITSVIDPGAAEQPLESAYSLAVDAGDQLLASYLTVPLMIAHDCRDDREGVLRTAGRAAAAAAPLGHELPLRWVAWSTARQALLAGELDRCQHQLGVARELSGEHDPEASCGTAALEALAAVHAGDLGLARERANHADQLARAGGAYWVGTGNVATALGFLALAENDLETARVEAERLVAWQGGGAHLAVHGHELLLLASLAGGDEAAARVHATALDELGERNANRRASALARYGAAVAALLAGDPITAGAVAGDAMELQLAGGWVPGAIDSLELIAAGEHVRGHVERAGVLADAAASARAERRLRRVIPGPAGTAEPIDGNRLGLGLNEALAFARSGGGRQSRPDHGLASLTPAERAVARRAADGLSNPEIAEQLVITRATVKTHLSHVYAKLGISRRSELPRG